MENKKQIASKLLIQVKDKDTNEIGYVSVAELMYNISNTIMDAQEFEKKVAKDMVDKILNIKQ